MHGIKVYGQVKYSSIHFLFSVLDVGERSTAQSEGFTSGEVTLCTHCIEVLKWASQVCLDALGKIKIYFPYRETKYVA